MSLENEGTLNCPVSPNGTIIKKARTGRLIPLKTTLEMRAQEKVIDVYITAVPLRQASGTLTLIRNLIPNDGGLNLQHLRRFSKYDLVPESVRTAFAAGRTSAAIEDALSQKLFLIIGSTNSLPEKDVVEALSGNIADLEICSIQVPLLAPTSQDQATVWTQKYWPTVYKKSNPFGPHPSLVSRAEEEIEADTRKWMALAAEVAQQSTITMMGEAVGVVIVERNNGVARLVAIAGDGRWLDWPLGGGGNVTAHAALRGIAMVANGLKSRDQAGEDQAQELEIFSDRPISELEEKYYNPSGNKTGYLCHELEIYCTHEPCVMCSMAIVHSRFGKVVFGKRMAKTGGLCADGDLGHGLFWRKELNWTLLAWQWVEEYAEYGDNMNLDLNA